MLKSYKGGYHIINYFDMAKIERLKLIVNVSLYSHTMFANPLPTSNQQAPTINVTSSQSKTCIKVTDRTPQTQIQVQNNTPQTKISVLDTSAKTVINIQDTTPKTQINMQQNLSYQTKDDLNIFDRR
jgi:hypothetical protein